MVRSDPRAWTSDNTHISALVSGYPERARAEAQLAFFTAYADDSSSDIGDRRLFMAGYLNGAGQWALFSDAWDEELRASPSIAYLKMVEANNLRGQFKGWTATARDEKLGQLARVIRHFRPFSFEVSIGRQLYFDHVKPVSPRGLASPHFVANFAVVSSVSRYFSDYTDKKIRFVFDRQDGVSDDVRMFFSHMATNLPRKARRIIAGTPIFEDDMAVMPLQTADMLAWSVRREHETGDGTLPLAAALRAPEAHLVSAMSDDIVMKWAAEFEEMPDLYRLQSKSQWREFKRQTGDLIASGFVPPHGSHWKNALHSARERITRLIRR